MDVEIQILKALKSKSYTQILISNIILDDNATSSQNGNYAS